ncbi:MAG: NIL domain-containing protein [Fimbriimonadaceae bacterium]
MTKVEIHITAGQESVGRPWIWQLSREFGVKVNIVRANIDSD